MAEGEGPLHKNSIDKEGRDWQEGNFFLQNPQQWVALPRVKGGGGNYPLKDIFLVGLHRNPT